MPDWKVVLVVCVVLPAAWYCWPVSYGGVTKTYEAIFTELQERRNHTQDKTGMTDFVARSNASLNEIIPYVEKRSSSRDPKSQILLWIGRDCLRPMLKNPRARDSKEERNYKNLMAQWSALDRPLASSEKRVANPSSRLSLPPIEAASSADESEENSAFQTNPSSPEPTKPRSGPALDQAPQTLD